MDLSEIVSSCSNIFKYWESFNLMSILKLKRAHVGGKSYVAAHKLENKMTSIGIDRNRFNRFDVCCSTVQCVN